MSTQPDSTKVPIEVRHLFRPLDMKLIELLHSLKPEEWHLPTVAKLWSVKDVASHLLDGNLRLLSLQRDKFFAESAPASDSYDDLVAWLNQLNADWVKATRRLSPGVLTLLLAETGRMASDYYETVPPFEKAIFAVSWAGEQQSYNWMHIAREYTEKWHHQQQIREATGREGILTHEYFFPVMNTFFQALPFTFRNTPAKEGTLIKISITSDAGGEWYLQRHSNEWQLASPSSVGVDSSVELSPALSWKLFSKSIRPKDIYDQVRISGNRALAEQVLEMVAVMA